MYMFIDCYMLVTVVEKKNSDIIAVVNISALRLCCDLMMARTMGRNMCPIRKRKLMCVKCGCFSFLLDCGHQRG